MQQNGPGGSFPGIFQGMPGRDNHGHPSPQQQFHRSSERGALLEHFYQNPQTNTVQHALPPLQNFPRLTTNDQRACASWDIEHAEETIPALNHRQPSRGNGLPYVCQDDSAVELNSLQIARWLDDAAVVERHLDAVSYLGPVSDQGAWQHFDELQQLAPSVAAESGPVTNCAPLVQTCPPGYVADLRTSQDGQIAAHADHAYEETLLEQWSANQLNWQECRPPKKLRNRLPPQAGMANNMSRYLTASSTEAFAAIRPSESLGNEAAMDFVFDVNIGHSYCFDNALNNQFVTMANDSSKPNSETIAPALCFVNHASEHYQKVVPSSLPSCSRGRSSATEGKSQRERKHTKAKQNKLSGSAPPEAASPEALIGSNSEYVHAYPESVTLPGSDTTFHSIELRPDLATSARTGQATEVPQAVQIQVLEELDASNNKFWSIVECNSEHEKLDPEDRKKWSNVTSASRRQMKEKRTIAMDKHVSALIALGLWMLPGTVQEVANSPMAQSFIRLAVRVRLIDPIEGSNVRRYKASALFKKIYHSKEVQDYINKIKQETDGYVDLCYLCLAAASNHLVKESHVSGRQVYEFKNDAVLNAVLALQFVRNDVANYQQNLKLLQLHVNTWPAGVLDLIELIRHEETLYHLGTSLSTSPIHFHAGCFCTEFIARALPYIESGEGAPPALVQLVHNHLPAKSRYGCTNLAPIAIAYLRVVGKPGWLHILPPCCPRQYAACLSIDGRHFNVAYVGKQQTYEYEQQKYCLPSYLHIFLIAEQEGKASDYRCDPKIEFSGLRQFLSEATDDSFDPCNVQFYCLATLSGFVALSTALLKARIVTESSPWGMLELTVNNFAELAKPPSSNLDFPGDLPDNELSMMFRLKPAALNIRALYLRIDVSTADFSSPDSLFSGSAIMSTVFSMLGLDTESALAALGNLAVFCFPLEKRHCLDGLFDNRLLWAKPHFFRAINCNLPTMNQQCLQHMLKDRSDDNMHHQGHLHIVNLSNNDFSNDTFGAVGPLLIEVFKHLRDLSLCFCNLRGDVLIGILNLAFCAGESKLEYLSLDGNQSMREDSVFGLLYKHLSEMPAGPTKLKRLSLTDIDFSAQQEERLYDWAKRRNAAAKSRFDAEICAQMAARNAAAAVGNASEFVEPIFVTRLNQPLSSAKAIPHTRCHNAGSTDWFNSIPKNKDFGEHFEFILS